MKNYWKMAIFKKDKSCIQKIKDNFVKFLKWKCFDGTEELSIHKMSAKFLNKKITMVGITFFKL